MTSIRQWLLLWLVFVMLVSSLVVSPLGLSSAAKATTSSTSLSSTNPALLTGLLGHWRLDEMSGSTMIDSSGNANNGTYETPNQALTWREGYIGDGSIVFTDNNRYTIPQSSSLNKIQTTQAMTLSFWYVPTPIEKSNPLFLRGSGDQAFEIGVIDKEGLTFYFNGGGGSFPYIFTMNRWNHVAITIAANTLRVYVDGLEVGKLPFTGTFNGSGTFYGGDWCNCGNFKQLDDLRLYGRALSPEQIKLLASEIKYETVAPTMPANFTFMGHNDRAGNFKWQASTDNIAVKGYQLYVNGKATVFTKNTYATVKNLEPDAAYSVYVRAQDLAGNLSAPTAAIKFQTDAQFDKQKVAVGVNLEAISDWMREVPFRDVFKTARPWENWTVPADYKWDKDEFGNIRSLEPGMDASTMMMIGQEGNYKKGKYILTYDGEGDLYFWSDQYSKVLKKEPGRMELDVQGDGIWLTLKSVNPSNYVRNIQVIHEDDLTTDATQIFREEYLAHWRDYKVIRFMDMMATNETEIVDWNKRTTPQHFSQSNYNTPHDYISGMSVEYMVALCNELQSDAWFNMPAMASDDYVQKFAAYVSAHLDPKLKVYIEYSNETWNGGFKQFNYAAAEGKKLGFKGSDFDSQAYYHAYRAKQMFIIWENAFGSAQKERLVNVIAGFAMLDKHYLNMILSYEDIVDYVDVYAIAAYFAGDYGGPKAEWVKTASKAEIFKNLPVQIEEMMRYVREVVAEANKYGIDVVAYEGGNHMSPQFYYWPTNSFYQNDKLLVDKLVWINRQPEMADIYKQYMDAWRGTGAKLHMTFMSSGAYTRYGSWGLLEYGTQTMAEAHKYRGLTEWTRDNPVWWNELTPSYYEPPVAVQATVKSMNTIDLAWSAPLPDAGVTDPVKAYEVYRDGQFVVRTTDVKVSLSGLVPNRSYRFGVKAIYDRGSDSGTSAELKSAQTKVTAKTFMDKVLPTVPMAVSATNVKDTSLSLTWQVASDNDVLKGYEVFQNRKKIVELNAQGQVVGKSSSVTDNGTLAEGVLTISIKELLPTSKYSFTVKSIDRSGNRSLASTAVSVITSVDTKAPSKPLQLRIVDERPGAVTVTWDAATDNKGVVRYDLYNYGTKFASTTSTKYTIRELKHGQWMGLAVAAVDATGLLSPLSDPIMSILPADTTAPTTPSDFGYTNLTASTLSLRWQASLDDVAVTSYEVYRDDTLLGTTNKPGWIVTGLSATTKYTFRVRAVDQIGNKSDYTQALSLTTPEASGNSTIKAGIVVVTYHPLTEELKASYTLSTQTKVSLALLDSTGGAQNGEIRQTLVNAQTVSGGTKLVTTKLNGLADGLYTLHLTAAGTTSSQQIRIDRTKPVVEITNDPPDIRQLQHVRKTTIDYTLSEPATVTLSLVTADGKLVHTLAKGESKPAGTYRLLWDGFKSGVTSIPDGSYFVKIEAIDRSGLRSTPVSKSLRIDRVPPAVNYFIADKTLLKLIGNNVMIFKYELVEDADVTFKIYNAAYHLRHTIAIGKQKKGKYFIVWNGKNSDGEYLSNQNYTFKLHLKDAVSNEVAIDGGSVRLQREFP